MKKICVTGASGFIGQHVIEPLQKHDFEVHALSHSNINTDEMNKNIKVHHVDLLHHNTIYDVLDTIQPTHLLHLAWTVEPRKFWSTDQNLDWVAASLHLYKSFAASGGKRFICAGTCAEYDWSDLQKDTILHEDHSSISPSTLYGQSKASLFNILKTSSEINNLSFAWGRIFFLYGPGEKKGRLISDVISSLLKKSDVETTEGTQIRDFMHVKDVAQAFADLCNSDVEGAVNIGTGKPHSLKNILQNIAALCDEEDHLKIGARPMPPNDPISLIADTSKLKSIGFIPKFDLHTGLKDAVEWWTQKI